MIMKLVCPMCGWSRVIPPSLTVEMLEQRVKELETALEEIFEYASIITPVDSLAAAYDLDVIKEIVANALNRT